jgi:hypothetical protein
MWKGARVAAEPLLDCVMLHTDFFAHYLHKGSRRINSEMIVRMAEGKINRQSSFVR